MVDVRHPRLVGRRDVEEGFVPARDEDVVLPQRRRDLPAEQVRELSGEAAAFERPLEQSAVDELSWVEIVRFDGRLPPAHVERRVLEDAGQLPSEAVAAAVGVFAPVGDSNSR